MIYVDLLRYIPLILIPLVSLLNHLGGQSTEIPNPRIVCRVLGIPASFGAITYLSGFSLETSGILWAICTLGMALWATPGWAVGFCCIPPYNDYRGGDWLSELVNDLFGYNSLTKLTPSQLHEWGIVYFTLRGGFMYPMWALLGWFLTPWAYLIGAGCFLQGVVYGNSKQVLFAEYIFGGLIGAMLGMLAILSLS